MPFWQSGVVRPSSLRCCPSVMRFRSLPPQAMWVRLTKRPTESLSCLSANTSSLTIARRGKYQHTRERLPHKDDSGLVLCFSQGMTDYCWREVPHSNGVRSPSVLHRETAANRVRLFGMPKGFPDTTAVGFQKFFYMSQVSSFVSNFASSIGYQSLLNGFFLGSSPQLWMLKDLVPALLAAYMANRVVSYENRPKFWFVVSVFMNNASVISDMLIPSLVPNHLLAAAIATSTVKQSSALMYFVTRAAALQHFAINNNLAELTKKFNSFGMVTYTVATALGIAYCTFVASFAVQLVTVVVCCALNMFLSSLSMSPIAFRLLNFGTMQVLMKYYVAEHKRVLTPNEMSDFLGVRMSPSKALRASGAAPDASELIYISPPIDKLIIRTDRLEEDVLFVSKRASFMLALWEPTPLPLSLRECWQRYELPGCVQCAQHFFSPRKLWKKPKAMDKVFHGKRLVLLAQQKCPARDLIAAYLILYEAVINHGENEASLRSFIRGCYAERDAWAAKGDELREALKAAGWDVDLPSLDHNNFRLTDLIMPQSMRAEFEKRDDAPTAEKNTMGV